MISVSLICATYRGAHRLGRLLDSMRGQDLSDCDLAVIDDGSPQADRIAAEVLTAGAPLPTRFIAAERRGWIAAINQAVPTTSGEAILLLDDDVLLPRDLLPTLRGLLGALPNLGALSWRSAGDKPGQSQQPRFGLLQPATELAAYCMAFRRAIWEELGGLDPRYQVYCSDSDFCLRAALAGHPCYRVWWPLVPHEEHQCAQEASEIDWQQIAIRDAQSFRDKWGHNGGPMETEALWKLQNV